MTRIFLFSILIGFFLGYAVRGHAAEIGTSARTTSPVPPTGKAYALTAALAYGPSTVSDRDSPDLSTTGNFREALLGLARETPRWAFGAGLGFFASDLTGTSRSTASTGTLGLRTYSRQTAGEVARVSAHYRITDRLEAGLSADLLFGSDVSFSPYLFDTHSNTAWLAAAEVLYGFDLAGIQWKGGARYFASLGLPARSLDAFQGVLEAARPIF